MAGILEPLTKSALDKMNKAEVVTYCLKIQQSVFTRLEALEKCDNSESNNVVTALLQRVEKLEASQAIQKSVIAALSKEVHRNGQYSRKDSIEVHGVDENIDDSELESKVCKLLSMSGEVVTPQDLHACHRLARKKNVICKFKCRKRKHAVIINKRKIQDSPSNKNKQAENAKKEMRQSLGFGRVWLNESMSSHFASMHWKCRMLHKQSKIDSYWFFNGHLYIKMDEDGIKIEIFEGSDLEEATGVEMNAFVNQFGRKNKDHSSLLYLSYDGRSLYSLQAQISKKMSFSFSLLNLVY